MSIPGEVGRARGRASRGPGRVSQAGGRVGGLAHLAEEPRAHLNAGRRGGWAGAFERGRAGKRREANGQAGGGREAGGRAHI